MALAPDGKIWSAGAGGIVEWDPESEEYIKYTREQGLPSNVAYNITVSTDGDVWAGMANGTVRFTDGQWVIDKPPWMAYHRILQMFW